MDNVKNPTFRISIKQLIRCLRAGITLKAYQKEALAWLFNIIPDSFHLSRGEVVQLPLEEGTHAGVVHSKLGEDSTIPIAVELRR